MKNQTPPKDLYQQITDQIITALEEGTNAPDSSLGYHECGHATGHKDRLNRDGVARFDKFGSEQYAFEELRLD
nr:zincin-like metallopeptidase domain-containing protein [Aggregatibacter actinomycetemcomitans]